jgi:hypothetical protein
MNKPLTITITPSIAALIQQYEAARANLDAQGEMPKITRALAERIAVEYMISMECAAQTEAAQ